MAATYQHGKPVWLLQEEQGQRSSDSAKRYTVDDIVVQYQSRSDNPTAKKAGS
jgi:hypothetical protein